VQAPVCEVRGGGFVQAPVWGVRLAAGFVRVCGYPAADFPNCPLDRLKDRVSGRLG